MRQILILFAGLLPCLASGQKFTLADTLRGSLLPARSCYDVTYYDLELDMNVEARTLKGANHIYFRAVADFDSLQVDLFDNMQVDSITFEGENMAFSRLYNAVFVRFPRMVEARESAVLSVFYQGAPMVAKRAPWDGGFVWEHDEDGNPWVGVACEGTGASLWWPNKDHLSDEPDSMRISCAVPQGLMCVANGELESSEDLGEKTRWNWRVGYPINNYNVTLNVADYAHFSDVYESASGEVLKLDYYVLRKNIEKAKAQFKQVHGMMDCFENAFGPYPFYGDGYALVETPYLGMEHQGAIAYGNHYKPGYMGRYPGDMDFDYIIIHETGHEWWGNSVSMRDLADMWIHESLCTYSEAVFVECTYGYNKMLEYLMYQRSFINNGSPIYGTYGVNQAGNSGDMYYKGAWMIHTFRSVLNNDSLFRSILKGIAQEFAYQNIDGEEVIEYINRRTQYDHSPFFNQYLKHADVPVLEYRWEKKNLFLRWNAEEVGFRMPVVFEAPKQGQKRVLVANSDWTTVPMPKKVFKEIKFSDDLFLFLAKELGG